MSIYRAILNQFEWSFEHINPYVILFLFVFDHIPLWSKFFLTFIKFVIFKKKTKKIKNVRSFVRTFTLNKVYRHTIPYFSHKLWVIPFPEMYSNRNLNGWNIFKYYRLHLKTTDMLHTCFWAFSPATVLL